MADPNELRDFQELYAELQRQNNRTPEYQALGEKAEAFLTDPGDMSPQAVSTVKKLAGLNRVFHSATNNYDPARGKALHTIHEEARTPVIDTRNHQLKTQVGGALNKRQPLTFLDPSGKEINGKRTLQKILSNFEILNDEDKEDPFHTVKYAVRLAEIGSDPPRFTPQSICDYIDSSGCLIGNSIQKEIGASSLQSLADTLNANYQSMIMNTNAGIPQGSRIDTRNAAMSSVAELLDVPDVVTRARPMQIVDENGRTVNGTFMMAAEGVDPNNVPKEASKINESAASGTNGNAFKQNADLQVLDYICGNVDRNSSNFFMKFNKKGKLTNVQGIDNDCSGGTIVPQYGNGVIRMTGTKYMRVISQSMYNKLKDLTDDQLKFALRGFGISEAEMDAHVERAKQVVTAAEKGIKYY